MKATPVSFGSSTMLKPIPPASPAFALLGPVDVAFLSKSRINSFGSSSRSIKNSKAPRRRAISLSSTHLLSTPSFTRSNYSGCFCSSANDNTSPFSVQGDTREQQAKEYGQKDHINNDEDEVVSGIKVISDSDEVVSGIKVISDSDEVVSGIKVISDSDLDGFYIELQKLGKRSRRIQSGIKIDASLQTVWSLLTNYERLPDFIPGLVRSELLEKRDAFARLFQVGQQSLAIGLKFNAKGIIDCYEKDLEIHSSGCRRCIEFKMIEGDFLTFEGKWSIEQYNADHREATDPSEGPRFCTILSYIVDVEPKRWLPVRLVEGRLCREIKTNLSSIKEEAQKPNNHTSTAC